ncbi:MAG: tetratricopeptide repeat protein [Burkholderiaceae bacterium]
MSAPEQSAVTFLFTDIEGSTRLWEQEHERMPAVMARHDAISREVIERHQGTIVKMRGDGVHAAFVNSLEAVLATIEIQQILQSTQISGVTLNLRCGLHAGTDERRDGDFYGRAVNRAARIACAAHGGQVLASKVVADQVRKLLPHGVALEDLGAVRLRDLASAEHVYQLQHPQLRSEFPPLRSLDSTPNNLVEQLNPFIGRERELTEIKAKLAANRLVTLLGMGGIGKSRLSMQLAADVLDDFPDGVWFVELAALTDSSSVPQAVASVLGVKEEVGKPVIEALIKYARERKMLIVLDNCEHVLSACADLAKRLLRASPTVKLLITSRDYLQIAGETTYQVPPLSVPDPKQGIDLGQLDKHEAVRLFLDRAAASLHGFGLSEQNAAAIADICYCLDGIPLAIELAAARVPALSVQNIAKRLSDRFRLLVTSDQTVLPRQRTLRALIDWSYDLLTEQERTLFQRLSVFAGGWTLEAAEAVCADEELPKEEVLDLLTQLIEKSLVVMELDGQRYRILDTVRHYAQEKLTQAGDDNVLRSRHFNFYLELAETARTQFGDRTHEQAMVRLDDERENLLSAHRWTNNVDGAADRGLRLASALKKYWIARGLMELGFQVMVDALARIDQKRRDLARCSGLFDAGQLLCVMGKYVECQRYLEESLAIAREIGDETRIVEALQPLGMTAVALGNFASASEYAEEEVALARKLGKQRQLAAALISLAQLHRIKGRLDAAEQLYEEALTLFRELGDQEAIAISLLNLAMVFIDRGLNQRAGRTLAEALVIERRIGSKQVAISSLDVAAALYSFNEAWTLAAQIFGVAEAQAKHAGLRRDAVDQAFLARFMTKVQSAIGAAAFTTCINDGASMTHDDALKMVGAWLHSEQYDPAAH